MTEHFTPEEVAKEYKKLETKKQKVEFASAFGWMWDEVTKLLAEEAAKYDKKH